MTLRPSSLETAARGRDHTAGQHVHPSREAFGHAHFHAGIGTTSDKETLAVLAESAVLTFALVTLTVGMVTREPEVGDLAINFVSIILEAMPFMMMGAVIGGIIESFVSPDFFRTVLAGRTRTGVFIAAALGMIFPVCECAIVPIVRRLINKGVPRPAAVAFLLGAPIVNPLVAASTWMAYRGNTGMVITRMVCGYIIAVSVALIFDFVFRNQNAALSDLNDSGNIGCCPHCGHEHHDHSHTNLLTKLTDAVAHARDDFFSIGKFLIIGAFVAALARATIDVDAFQQLFPSPVLSILAMMGLAVALNLCSETDAFIAAGFRGIFPDTAQMAFMVLGPMLDMKLVLSYFTIFTARTIRFLSLLTIATVLTAILILHYGFGGIPGAN